MKHDVKIEKIPARRPLWCVSVGEWVDYFDKRAQAGAFLRLLEEGLTLEQASYYAHDPNIKRPRKQKTA